MAVVFGLIAGLFAGRLVWILLRHTLDGMRGFNRPRGAPEDRTRGGSR